VPPAVFKPLEILPGVCVMHGILRVFRVWAIGEQEWLLDVAVVPI
jgi:hypothetical protein